MDEGYLTVINKNGHVGTKKKKQMIKTYSFTTDEEETIAIADFQQDTEHLNLLTIESVSMNNGNELSDNNNTIKRRKSRQHAEHEHDTGRRHSSIKKQLWYTKIDWTKPLIFIALLFLLYLIWIKREIWISRLLSSNTRHHHPIITKEPEISDEIIDLSSHPSLTTITTKDTSSIRSHGADIVENTNENNNINTTNGTISEQNEDSSTTKSSNNQKLNIKIRRNQMSFNKERTKKKNRPLQDQSVVDNDDQDDKKQILPSIHNSLKKADHRQAVTNNLIIKTSTELNTNIRPSTYDGLIEQLRKSLKSRSRNRDFLLKLSKTTGLNKAKLHRFIYGKDDHFITFRTLISILDTLNLMILIVPKKAF